MATDRFTCRQASQSQSITALWLVLILPSDEPRVGPGAVSKWVSV